MSSLWFSTDEDEAVDSIYTLDHVDTETLSEEFIAQLNDLDERQNRLLVGYGELCQPEHSGCPLNLF
jgi:hypothetical protein